MDKLAYTTTEASEMLGISTTTMRKLLENGDIRGVRIERKWLVPLDSLKEYLGTSKQTGLTTREAGVHTVILNESEEIVGIQFDPGAPLQAAPYPCRGRKFDESVGAAIDHFIFNSPHLQIARVASDKGTAYFAAHPEAIIGKEAERDRGLELIISEAWQRFVGQGLL